MPTFSWIATYGSRQTTKPNVEQTKFSDGYEVRVAIGINFIARKWDLAFDNRPNATADAIEAFLQALGAVESFDWTPPYGVLGKWVRREWRGAPTSPNTCSVSAEFDEVFEA